MASDERKAFEEREQQIAKKLRREEVNSFFSNITEFLFTAPFVLPVYQAWQWLQHGQWPPFTAALAVDATLGWRPVVSWIGVQHLIDGVLQTPLLILLYLAAALVWITLYILRKILFPDPDL